jgi:predicted RNA binding protein YcfA (HicA-like mRNA interferase family)
MRLPRDLSGNDLAQALSQLGYSITRQAGSHLRLTTLQHGEHHITIPQHSPLRIGTLSAILTDVATHFDISRDQLVAQLFGLGK